MAQFTRVTQILLIMYIKLESSEIQIICPSWGKNHQWFALMSQEEKHEENSKRERDKGEIL